MTNSIIAKQIIQPTQQLAAAKKTNESSQVFSVASADKEESKIAADGIALPARESKETATKEIEKAVTQINDYVQNLQRNLHFSVDEESGRTIIRVVDSATDELIRQIPSEKLLAVSQALEEFSGLLLEAKA